MPRTRIAHTLDVWEKLLAGAEAEESAKELENAPELQLYRQQLQESRDEIRRLSLEQSHYEAQKQLATRKINELLEAGRITATAMKVGLRVRFGNRSSDLVRFGIRPFHRRKRAPAPDGEASNGSEE
jgi:hypothetical protein